MPGFIKTIGRGKRFNNACIKEPRPGKPHIVFIGGFWRVSAVNKYSPGLSLETYEKAHKFTNALNAKMALAITHNRR